MMSCFIQRLTWSPLLLAACATGVASQTTVDAGDADKMPASPEIFADALQFEEWFKPGAQDVADYLGIPVEMVLNPDIVNNLVGKKAAFLKQPLGEFVGVFFSRKGYFLEPVENSDQLRDGDPIEKADHPSLADSMVSTTCTTVSENPLEDGLATAFQFGNEIGDGYSLHFLIYDYDGPGFYPIGTETKNYMKYVPNALGATVVTSRQISGVRSAIELMDEVHYKGGIEIRELPDSSLLGWFSTVGLGSTDLAASQAGDRDKFFENLFYGYFRTPPLDGPVENTFVPLKPLFGMGMRRISPPCRKV